MQNLSLRAGEAGKPSLSERAYELIRGAILSGDIVAGSRLKMETLQRQYTFSSSPLREALNRLAAEGLVGLSDHRGFRVADVSANDLRDITNFRLNIECASLVESIQAGGDDWEAEIVAAFHRLSVLTARDTGGLAVGTDEWTERHKAFHMALIGRCASGRQLATCASLFDQAERYRRLSVATRRKKRDSGKEHRALMDAALARDAALAVELLREHITRTSDHVGELLAAAADGAGPGARVSRRRQSSGTRRTARAAADGEE